MISPTGSTPDEARAFLDAHPHIEAFDIVLTDANGVGRGKIIRRHELIGLYERGRGLPTSILGLDIAGEDVHETGLVWKTGDGDLAAWPVPGTLVPLHGTAPARGQVLLSLHQLDGRPMPCDPRHTLSRQVQAFSARGLRPAGAFELEFFLLTDKRGDNGEFRPARALADGRASSFTDVYSVDHLHGMEPLVTDIYAAAEAQGIPAETIISEYAPGQYELTLRYRDDISRAADDLIMIKRIVRMQARRHGLNACFMAKPMRTHAGSGMHLHVSMKDSAGHNVFAEEREGTWNPALLHAIGGLRQTMAESMLVFAPHANSWRRFVEQSYAPVASSWGSNNRSVALRVPAGDATNRRIEHRPAGVDANPYLVAATVLAGIAAGMEGEIDPGPATTGNGYEATGDKSNAMPPDWRSAIERATNSVFLKDALGKDMHRVFCAIKQAEYLRVARTISHLDYELYLHSV
ncbi:MAG: glutamine synthetase family protein [Rhizobiaceae bacterium]|nr:glutamine synthetase family protein [Rhizobiaceae bacterium]MCV0408494.1 glutamine synthetase family protein [Rhizobiaceae bacterium]